MSVIESSDQTSVNTCNEWNKLMNSGDTGEWKYMQFWDVNADDTSLNNMFYCMTTFGDFSETYFTVLEFYHWVSSSTINESNQDALASKSTILRTLHITGMSALSSDFIDNMIDFALKILGTSSSIKFFGVSNNNLSSSQTSTVVSGPVSSSSVSNY